MPTDRIQDLRREVPEAFEDLPLAPDWDEEWLFVSIPNADKALPQVFEDGIDQGDQDASPVAGAATPETLALMPTVPGRFPGAPIAAEGSGTPPPEAWAFYLPFHYFHPTWWGIYLTVEGTLELARFLKSQVSDAPFRDALLASQVFLHGHEAFHHLVECFAARLEVTHREAAYRLGFERLYRGTQGTDKCVEEGLANAHALHRVSAAFRRTRPLRTALMRALEAHVRDNPPGYRLGVELAHKARCSVERAQFAEVNHTESLKGVPTKHPRIWNVFPHAFSGLARLTSRVNYLVHQNSPLAQRLRLRMRFLRYRDLARRLRIAGAEIVGSGKGSHEKWRASDGNTFVVPRHPGDLASGTLAKIIKQAGLGMSVSEFLRE